MHKLRQSFVFAVAASAPLAFGMVFHGAAHAQEVKIKRSQVPAAVMTQFQTTYPNATIRGTNKETKGGTAYYVIESRDGDVRRDLLYAADGTVQEIEEIIPAAQLPNEVASAIQTGHPGARIKSVEKNTQGSVVHYEVLLREKGKKNFEVIYNPDGTVVTP